MKKILLITLMLVGVKAFAQDDVKPTLFPVVDNKVMYESIVPVNDQLGISIHSKALDWYIKNFKAVPNNIISSETSTGELLLGLVTDVNNLTVAFKMQIDCKDNKYRCRIFDIKSTVKGKENAVFFRKYLINVPAELYNQIVAGEVKGYDKSQKRDIQSNIIAMDEKFKGYMNSLEQAVNVKSKASADF